MSKKLALQVSRGSFLMQRGFNNLLPQLYKYRLIVWCKYKTSPYVQVKNKPCAQCSIIIRLISWNHSRGSETVTIRCNLRWKGEKGGDTAMASVLIFHVQNSL
jgi:hypothetical protein